MFKNKLFAVNVGIAFMLFSLWLQFSSSSLARNIIDRVDSIIYDLRLNLAIDEQYVDSRIVIVDIDERSLHVEGQWPWTRDKIASLVEKVSDYGAGAIGFDIVFAEKERSSLNAVINRANSAKMNISSLENLTKHSDIFDNDLIFAKTLRDKPVVLGYIFHPNDDYHVGALPQPINHSFVGQTSQLAIPAMSGYTGPLAVLAHAAAGTGFFSLRPDADGSIRRTPLLYQYEGNLYPSLALETVRTFLEEPIDISTAEIESNFAVEAVTIGNIVIPTDKWGQVLVPYHGPRNSFPYVSATDILHDAVDPDVFNGTIVLVGTSATGLFDLRSTPVNAVYPGVEVHANVIAGILDQSFPAEPSWAKGVIFLIIVVVGIALAFIMPYLSAFALVSIYLPLLIGLGIGDFYAWVDYGLNIPIFSVAFLISAITIFNMAWGFIGEARSRNLLKGMFGQYVPPELVEEMSHRPDQYGFEGESKELTVLFCDVRSFTTISEMLNANQLKSMLNRYFTPMTKIIFEHRGTIDKYVGDMIMAFWGAPVSDDEHETHAVIAALEMQRVTTQLRTEFVESGLPELHIGIGINTGLMNVGDMGSEFRRAYTVIGDAVNLGSRLEASSKDYGAQIVVGETTWAKTKDRILYRELDLVKVKGKNEAIHIFEPIGPLTTTSSEDHRCKELLDLALLKYRSQAWDDATSLFTQLSELEPNRLLYPMYLERISSLRNQSLVPQWDGVFVRTTK